MDERDACALVAIARKDGAATREVLAETIRGLECLAHRSGSIDGEGDGAGVLTDIPRELWADALAAARLDPSRVLDRAFAVAHLFVPPHDDELVQAEVRRILARHRIRILLERHGTTRRAALGPRAQAGEPRFWQLALQVLGPARRAGRRLYRVGAEVEQATSATIISLSRSTAVYKLRGHPQQLSAYFTDLADPRFRTSMAFGHDRFATNTTTSFERVQPFAAFAHNGEINTIARLREEAASLGLALSRDGSDSQDVDATLRALVLGRGLDPIEALELLFPPIVNEVRRMDPQGQDAFTRARAAFGPFAQGPAAFVARVGDLCLVGVDAMGLRPLWHVETDEAHVFASERGFIPLERYSTDPRPLAPGEHAGLERTARGWRYLDEPNLRARFVALRAKRGCAPPDDRRRLEAGGPAVASEAAAKPPGRRIELSVMPDEIEDLAIRREQQFAALGYEPEDLKQAAFMEETGNEPIGSLGYDGPLAALATKRANLADYLQETVAVVTNPAIDREREIEHFSTRVVIGPRPSIDGSGKPRPWLELRVPLLLGGHAPESAIALDDLRPLARAAGTWLVEDLVAELGGRGRRAAVVLEADRDWEEDPRDALTRLANAATHAVRGGTRVVLVRDRGIRAEGRAWIDPLLVIAAAHRALIAQPAPNGSLRRECALLLSSGSLRNLHDVVVALGLGADAVNPYLLFEHALATGDPDALPNLLEALRKGIEKVCSTLGMHEVRGYGRAFSAIGLTPDVAAILGVRTFGASTFVGTGWDALARDGFERATMLRERTPARLEPAFRIYPRLWKAALGVATGETAYAVYAEKLAAIEAEHPVSLRHALDVRPAGPPAEDASTTAGEHSAPFYISSMSFGSQGETAYRAYAEAAKRLDILCINGEGGELPDLLGKYPKWRGQQIASGRFGVSALLANSSHYLEIKIGQGAKPGEGGHLPGRKVSAKVALARNAKPGVDLISPSNNHDIYSIEDLAQVVRELKTVNPDAKVSVKVPAVPDIGIIATGIAKSGADIVTVSGYDGGTGAARQHALRRAGLPAEIGVVEAHRALVRSGLRDRVELWCDGGMKSALDIVKMLCLGADRVGFGTLAMVAIGCTICRGCQLDTCHVGIATQIESIAEATERGMKRFEPQELDRAVAQLERFFGAMRADLARIVASLGLVTVRDLVGRSDLLRQVRARDRLDLAALLEPAGETVSAGALVTAGALAAVADEPLSSAHRFVGTAGSGSLARARIGGTLPIPQVTPIRTGSVAGNGFGAYLTDGMALDLGGGAQDGAAKTALGGTVTILKAPNAAGTFVDGGVGKCFAYGAQRGRFFVQGGADARACIRLSGALVVLGGDLGGFAFEYMTAGTAVVLGDPGRWICSGMSGGIVFVRVDATRGIDPAGIHARLAKGAKVHVGPPRESELPELRELLAGYGRALLGSGQDDDADVVRTLAHAARTAFLAIRPGGEIVDQTVSTE
ncbi:MAG TPA: glutamate synthase [Chloroflexi bacterium]|jgi:glutamate synthase (NADPH/NADH) large chain|nr:glutamate synthase [Chloroflexota bacterium]